MKFNYARFVTFRKFSFAFIRITRMIINNSMRLESQIDIYIYVFY